MLDIAEQKSQAAGGLFAPNGAANGAAVVDLILKHLPPKLKEEHERRKKSRDAVALLYTAVVNNDAMTVRRCIKDGILFMLQGRP